MRLSVCNVECHKGDLVNSLFLDQRTYRFEAVDEKQTKLTDIRVYGHKTLRVQSLLLVDVPSGLEVFVGPTIIGYGDVACDECSSADLDRFSKITMTETSEIDLPCLCHPLSSLAETRIDDEDRILCAK